MLMAMLDGIKNKTKPGEPLDKDIYDLEPEELAKVPKTPGALDEALISWKRTTSSCSKATSSPATSSALGSGTSAKKRWTRSGSGRIRMSLRCIMIFSDRCKHD